MPRRMLAALAVVALAPGPAATESVLRIVPQADLKPRHRMRTAAAARR